MTGSVRFLGCVMPTTIADIISPPTIRLDELVGNNVSLFCTKKLTPTVSGKIRLTHVI